MIQGGRHTRGGKNTQAVPPDSARLSFHWLPFILVSRQNLITLRGAQCTTILALLYTGENATIYMSSIISCVMPCKKLLCVRVTACDFPSHRRKCRPTVGYFLEYSSRLWETRYVSITYCTHNRK